MKKTLSATFIVAALALSACGGDGGGRPTSDEVSKSLTGKDSVFGSSIPGSAADCVADALVKSKLSDKTLNAIVKGDKDYDGNEDDKKALTSLTADFTKCVTK